MLKAFARFLARRDYISANPFNKIDASFRKPMVFPKTIPLNIIEQILANAYTNLKQNNSEFARKSTMRDVEVLEILFATCARVSEICNPTPQTVDLLNHTIRIFGKDSKERIIQIENPDALNSLAMYYKAFYDDVWAMFFLC